MGSGFNDIALGVLTGGLYSILNDSGDEGASVTYPQATNYSAAMAYLSDNNKTTALAQVGAQIISIQQASADRQAQMAVQLELGLERLDTKLQASKLEYLQQMTALETEKKREEKGSRLYFIQVLT